MYYRGRTTDFTLSGGGGGAGLRHYVLPVPDHRFYAQWGGGGGCEAPYIQCTKLPIGGAAG
jgi:hypothetical protein